MANWEILQSRLSPDFISFMASCAFPRTNIKYVPESHKSRLRSDECFAERTVTNRSARLAAKMQSDRHCRLDTLVANAD